MAFTFDGINKLIYLSSGTTSFDAKILYSDWKNWVGLGDNSKYQVAFQTIGGDPISSELSVSPYFFIANGWKIRPYETSHNLLVNGNIFVDGGVGNPFVNTTGNYNVMINLSTSNNAVLLKASDSIGITDLNKIETKIDDLTALSL